MKEFIIKTITVDALHTIMAKEEITLIDVRTPAEFESLHAQGAINIPLDIISTERVTDLNSSQDSPIYLICQTGSRAESACAKLSENMNLVIVNGGTQAWNENALPIIQGEQVISLERQVHITAGSMVFIATGLGALVSPYFLGISGFVGAGLAFAGVTDTCGMGILLSKMPWNQKRNVTPI